MEERRGPKARPAARRDGVPSGKRAPYKKPSVTEYGSIRKLTRSGGSTRLEGSSGRIRMR